MNSGSFVESLRIAAPYIHAHRGATFVVLVGGEAVRSERLAPILHDVALLHGLGVRVVLVHGTRPQIEKRLEAKKIPARFVGDTRVTDRATLACVHEAVGAARARIEAALSMGTSNTPMANARIRVLGGNFITARPIGVRDGVDFLWSGEVRRVDTAGIERGLDAGAIVLISPLGASPTGESFNLASHDVAADVAIALGAKKLVGLIEGRGITDARRRLVTQLTPNEADALVAGPPRQGADVRKHVMAAARAVRGGVPRAHLVDRRRDGALLEELFTREGIGTLVTKEAYEDVRPARMEDLGPLATLLHPLEEQGILVRRSRERLEMELDRFVVIDRDGLVIGCAALEPFPESGMGELYCVAIHERYREAGRGEALLERLEERARGLGLSRMFVLTTRSAHFFQERGFVPASVRQLPPARRASYDRSRRSRVLTKTLT
ncbi:MAG: amino-acid N-acetyltransferase [Sandaracinaceae bacterium]|nr:amino-acid N-acetyltransferase [Sandaracinaceae bacterium]